MRPQTARNILANIQENGLIRELAAIEYESPETQKQLDLEKIKLISGRFLKHVQESPLTEKEKAKHALASLHDAITKARKAARSRCILLGFVVTISVILAVLASVWSDLIGKITTSLGGGIGSIATFASVKDSIFSYFDLNRYLDLTYSKIEFEYNQGNYGKVIEMVRKALADLVKSAYKSIKTANI